MQQKRRLCISAGAALTVSMMIDGCASIGVVAQKTNATTRAVVDATYTAVPGAVINGVPHYKTLQQALDGAPTNGTKPWRIALRNGRYHEKLEVTKPHILLVGESRSLTVITFDAYAGQKRPGSASNWTTAGCATLTVRAPDFTASNLTIENAYDYLSNDGKSTDDPSRSNDPQAVAFMLAAGSDRACLRDVTMTGHQDTLFVDAGRSYFANCTVSGGVDFIFGAGQAVFDTCDIVSRPRRKPNIYPIGYVTAPSTQIRDQYGLVFLRCKLLKESALVPAGSTALGRPWHPVANMPDGRYADPNAIGSSVFIDCFMDDHITIDGWFSMTGQQKSGPVRTTFLHEDSRFFEYRSTGPGAALNAKRRQLTDVEVLDFAASRVLRGWQPL